MFKHLLVTLDGTPRSEAVVRHALDVATSMGAEVTLLRVIDTPTQDWGERGAVGKQATAPPKSIYVEQANAYLARVAKRFEGSGVRTHTSVRSGPPAKQIVVTAKEIDADAIAMATHSRRGLNRLMFGSVAEAVLHDTQLPILLIRA
jgi:nucleotide-binding universal stress UspA family protein